MRKNFIMRIICIVLAIITVTPTVAVSAEERSYMLCKVMIEATGGVIIESVNEDVQVPVGTMAKLMTVLLAAEAVEAGKLSLDSRLKTSEYANSMQGAQIWLMPGETITVDELFKAVIIGNANDAAVVLAENIAGSEEKFVEYMNIRAKELGMENTCFTNCNGYYDDDKQISTAYDIAKLCAELSNYDFLCGYFTCWRDFVRGGETELVNSNEAVKDYKGLIGFKAGFTESSGYCTALGAERDGVTYISVVLGCDDKDISLSDAKLLLSVGFSQYTVFTPERPKDVPTEIAVRGGMTKTVPVTIGSIRSVVLPNGAAGSVTSRIVMTDYLYAPVENGRKVGEIQFLRNDKMIFSVDIFTEGTVEKMNVKKALGIILKKLLTF
ncbi:MAG: D-alanyl-D-alanine carboxypeptidase [Oscillospiraceae bacterium]|nr:D-alanyl-D-alanine carboxypeptidase [Oscillospiraceae bacterium]